MDRSRPISPRLVETIGTPVVRQKLLSLFCGGNEFMRKVAGIEIRPTHPPEYFEPQNYPRITQPEQGEQ